jgi:hypothetical protein
LRQCPDRDAFRAGRNLPDKEFRYLRTVIVTAAVYRGFGSARERLPLTFRHWAGITPYTSPCGLSRELWFCYPVARAWTLRLPRAPPASGFTLRAAPLLPKVRGQFAEFLNQGSLVRLGLLDLPTCVGLRYGRGRSPERAFLDCTGATQSAAACAVASPSPLGQRAGDFVPALPTGLDGARLAAGSSPQHPALVKRTAHGTGISTCCPSPTPGGYGLGPTTPPRITRAAEPLGFRRWGFLPHFAVTHSGIRTRAHSTGACAPTSPHARRSPTEDHSSRSFGAYLGPVEASAQRYSTSELLRTRSRVAASKPTSWLSARRHSLSHSGMTGGP